MYRIGITETGDPAFNLQIFDKLEIGNIIITKFLTPQLIDKLREHKNKCILHLTVTGMGGTIYEPYSPSSVESKEMFDVLIKYGFPVNQVVLRIDPIIPTKDGIDIALNVIKVFKDSGIKRVRFSSLDMYEHVIERFKLQDMELPYSSFHAPDEMFHTLYKSLINVCYGYGIELEGCAENVGDSHNISCISQKDIDILGLTDKVVLEGSAKQRKGCGCPSNKIQLIKGTPKRCPNQCVYCFWKN